MLQRKAKIFGKGKNGSTTPKEEYINTGGLVNDSVSATYLNAQ